MFSRWGTVDRGMERQSELRHRTPCSQYRTHNHRSRHRSRRRTLGIPHRRVVGPVLAGRKRKGLAGVVVPVPAGRKGMEQEPVGAVGPALVERRGKEQGPVVAVGPALAERRRKGQGPAEDQGQGRDLVEQQGRGLEPQEPQNRLPTSLK